MYNVIFTEYVIDTLYFTIFIDNLLYSMNTLCIFYVSLINAIIFYLELFIMKLPKGRNKGLPYLTLPYLTSFLLRLSTLATDS